jgi:NaMN:DMB phosphoribosyltransferase
VVREGVEAGGEMTQALYAHMNNKTIKKKKKKKYLDRV